MVDGESHLVASFKSTFTFKFTLLHGGNLAGVVFLFILVSSYIWWISMKRRRERALDQDFEKQLPFEDMPSRFTYEQLSEATTGFSKNAQLGIGGSSSVYRGVISSTGTEVAVKKIDVSKNQIDAEKLFAAEVTVISRLRHRNVVKLLGWCRDRGNYLLVYELMPNRSLDKILYEDSDETNFLSWTSRLTIIRGVAAALAYLHEGCEQQVVHRDIKSSNVMLDKELNPKVGDFGLARLIEHTKNLETTQVAGTLGYIAPEAISKGIMNEKTDVYAFGALVLEIACSRPPIANGLATEKASLIDWVWKCYGDGDILQAADYRLLTAAPEDGGSEEIDVAGEFAREEELTKILLLGLLCCHPNPNERLSMRDVEHFLGRRIQMPPVSKTQPVPPFHGTELDGNYAESDVGEVGDRSLLTLDEKLSAGRKNRNYFRRKLYGHRTENKKQPRSQGGHYRVFASWLGIKFGPKLGNKSK